MQRPYPEPTLPPKGGDDEPDVRKPPVPPDQAPDVIPQTDPPKPGRREKDPPMIA